MTRHLMCNYFPCHSARLMTRIPVTYFHCSELSLTVYCTDNTLLSPKLLCGEQGCRVFTDGNKRIAWVNSGHAFVPDLPHLKSLYGPTKSGVMPQASVGGHFIKKQ